MHRVIRLLGGREVRADFRVAVPVFLTEHRVGGARFLLAFFDESVHAGRQRGDDVRILLGDVDVLFRIVDQIKQFDFGLEVEVRFQRADEFPLRCAPTVLAHPCAFRDVEFGAVGGLFATDERHEGFAVEFDFRIDLHEIHERGNEILMAAPAFDTLAGGNVARPTDDQRHAKRVVVDGVVVEEAVVVIERFAVVGGDDDDRVVIETERG